MTLPPKKRTSPARRGRPSARLLVGLAAALVLASPAPGALAHGLPVRLAATGPEISERSTRTSTGGLGSQQDWLMAWAAAETLLADYENVIPPEFAYVPGTVDCVVRHDLTGEWLSDCNSSFIPPDMIVATDVPLEVDHAIVVTYSTTLVSCPPEDGAGFAIACDQGMLTHSPPEPPQIEMSDDFPTLATPDPTCITFLACSSNQAPVPGGDLSCEASGDCEARLEWPAAMEPEGEPLSYRIYRGIGPGNVEFAFPYREVTGLNFTSSGLDVGVEYCFVVRSTDSVNESQDSNECCVVAEDFTPPIEVRPFTLTASGCTVAVSYLVADACTGIEGYDVYRDVTTPVVPGPGTLVASEPWLPFLDEIPDDGTYYYRVVARTSTGEFIEPGELSIDVTSCRASYGEPLIHAAREASDLSLSWEAIPDVDSYALYVGSLESLWMGLYGHEALSDPGACSLVEPMYTVTDGCSPGSTNSYYLATVRRENREGILGSDSLGARRPAATVPCP